jgi:hypothetical protein
MPVPKNSTAHAPQLLASPLAPNTDSERTLAAAAIVGRRSLDVETLMPAPVFASAYAPFVLAISVPT